MTTFISYRITHWMPDNINTNYTKTTKLMLWYVLGCLSGWQQIQGFPIDLKTFPSLVRTNIWPRNAFISSISHLFWLTCVAASQLGATNYRKWPHEEWVVYFQSLGNKCECIQKHCKQACRLDGAVSRGTDKKNARKYKAKLTQDL